MERIFEVEFWIKWFVVFVLAICTLIVFSVVFDRTLDYSPTWRFVLGVCGFSIGGIAVICCTVE